MEGKDRYVIKRDGSYEAIDIQKIKFRLQKLLDGLATEHINLDAVVEKVSQGIYNRVPTTELDNLAAETCAYMNVAHPDYSKLAARIAISNLHKMTKASFAQVVRDLHSYIDSAGRPAQLVSDEVFEIVQENAEVLEATIDFTKDYEYDFFGFKTLERSYLLRLDGEVAERPQHMLMRVSIGIHKRDIDKAVETYNLMSDRWFTHASPTLFNAGTLDCQMSSCFLLTMREDSIEGVFDTLKQSALISRSAGGIGIAVSNIRAQGSYIRGSCGTAKGLIPIIRVFNDTARYVDQGGGKRKGSFALYLEPWHADVFDFLQLRKNQGKEEQRARDLFYALWTPDLFMKRVQTDGDWTLMCPNSCPGLTDVYGAEFEALYERYESEGLGVTTIKAQKLWAAIMDAQIETGLPYMMYKDASNSKSNQKNLGTIKCSNLCTEIIQYCDKDEIAVCNLASISLAKFVTPEHEFDFQKLAEITKVATRNLNKVIDANSYPLPECKTSNHRHRPIGLGVQGLADALLKLRYPYESPQAAQLNKDIFETIYYSALEASCELAQVHGTYDSYQGSPVSQGILQPDMWGVKTSSRWNWASLRANIAQHGVRNSLLVAPMPTASTSQILGNNESFEPYTSNIYTRRVLAGEFVCVNPHLVIDMILRGLWTSNIKNKIISQNGSIQGIAEIPSELANLYKTVWEIPQRTLIDMAADRAPFIDQSQSLNIYMRDASFGKMTSMHFYAWNRGLKTGMYYLRSLPAADAIKFTVDVEKLLVSSGLNPKSATPFVEVQNVEVEQWRAKTGYNEDDDVEVCISCSG